MTAADNQLHYAALPPWHRRKSTRRILALLITIAAALAFHQWFDAAWNRVRLCYWQNKCLQYQPADNTLVYNAGPTFPASCWTEFYKLYSPPGRRAAPTVFLHALQQLDGRQRLVCVELSRKFAEAEPSGPAAVEFEKHVFEPATPWSPARLLASDTQWLDLRISKADAVAGKITPARIDPKNPAHFTFNYDYKNRKGTVDGWLQPDDTILLEPRTASASLP